jgi:predicted esterase
MFVQTLKLWAAMFVAAGLLCGFNGTAQETGETDAVTMTCEQAVQSVRQYLSLSADERRTAREALGEYRGPIEPVVEALSPVSPRAESRKGEIRAAHFTAPGLREKYPDDLLYFFVPDRYNPAEPFGLLIFMHGGDGRSPRERAGVIVSSPDDDSSSYRLRPHIEDAAFITVAPSAPLRKTGQRWNVPQADAYIAAVIEECAHRFYVDGNRVFLGGHSMGGYGAYHLSQRLNDRIAGCLLSAGAWKVADFRSLAGTGVSLIHGANDTAPGASPVPGQGTRQNAWTGVSFARAAVELMKRDGIEHVYHEHSGGHAFRDGKDGMAVFIRWTGSQTRNPFPKRVVAVSPRGSWLLEPVTPTPHSYWVSINEVGPEAIEYDSIRLIGPNIAKTAEDLTKQGYALGKTLLPGGRVDAVLKVNNVIEVKTENVRSFSLWLHPKMVDLARPVTVVWNGAPSDHVVSPSLLDALRSYERRRDWGLIYHAELVIGRPQAHPSTEPMANAD